MARSNKHTKSLCINSFAVLLLLIINGCQREEPLYINASTPGSYNQSVLKITQTLSEEEAQQFTKSLVLIEKYLNLQERTIANDTSKYNNRKQSFYAYIDNKTIGQVLETGKIAKENLDTLNLSDILDKFDASHIALNHMYDIQAQLLLINVSNVKLDVKSPLHSEEKMTAKVVATLVNNLDYALHHLELNIDFQSPSKHTYMTASSVYEFKQPLETNQSTQIHIPLEHPQMWARFHHIGAIPKLVIIQARIGHNIVLSIKDMEDIEAEHEQVINIVNENL